MAKSKTATANLAYLTIDGVAVWAFLCLSTLFVDSFADLRASQIVNTRSPEIPEERATLWFGQQNTRAVLVTVSKEVHHV